jgi:uncharacterized protein YegL
MRRLPVYFLIDVSESMVGDPIQYVEEGIAMIVKELKSDPHALETVWISVIVFAGQAKTLVPLQEIVSFYPPRFPIGSGTSLCNGLGHLMFELRRNVVKTTSERKGDWKPLVFLFTDGVPSDDSRSVIAEWKQNWQNSANLVAISLGDGSDLYLLREMTEHVLSFKNTTQASYKTFFQWISASIKSSSAAVETTKAPIDLAKIDDETLTSIDFSKLSKNDTPLYDINYAIMLAKCQNTKRPYLMKYKKGGGSGTFYNYGNNMYQLVGSYPVDNQYFELSDEAGLSLKINTSSLVGAPNCPCCGNQFGFAMCSCGKLHCHGFSETSTCPWCGQTNRYGSGGDANFDVNRTQG